ncbi:nucleotidyltransferase family protein [Altericroceibacterium spongiae]|uniref:nucleotidyltransferase family protein n=1 Tax=Altericroceibacterium spongiae TaxID=2320269 RepID=UPI001601778A|nr:NTP transferase domain-containing protein [Altericroceibacterium spongiae]
MTDRIIPAILAAGQAVRFGGDKLDQLCAGKRLGEWAVAAVEATGLPPGVIVTNRQVPHFANVASGWKTLQNDTPEAGISSSLRIMAEYVLHHDYSAALILLADMPLIPAGHLQDLCHKIPSATDYGGQRLGVPATLSRALLTECLELTGDRGAGPILSHNPYIRGVSIPSALLLDVDEPDDLMQAEQRIQDSTVRRP